MVANDKTPFDFSEATISPHDLKHIKNIVIISFLQLQSYKLFLDDFLPSVSKYQQ